MRWAKHYLLPLSGATAWEWQWGQLVLRVLKPRYYCWGNLSRLIVLQWFPPDRPPFTLTRRGWRQ